MAGVERVERGPAYDYFDEPETPRAPEVKAPAIEQPSKKLCLLQKKLQKKQTLSYM
jgi:hypothetical protein